MANEAKKISEFTACNAPTVNNMLAVVGNTSGTANTFKLTIGNLFGNSQANWVVGNNFYMSANILLIRDTRTPANSASLGYTPRALWFDDDYLYIVTTGGVIKRAALTSF
jgi:hypothetical protein